jgi:glycosyltransferase involved in cell wall biosynthesis
MSAKPRISVVIPGYNAAAFIGQAIESALRQTYSPIEVIVVDDGSQDNTAEVASSYPRPVRVIRRSNGGPGAARNLGVSMSEGNWIALLDADDTWLPAKLQRQITYITRPEIGIMRLPEDSAL